MKLWRLQPQEDRPEGHDPWATRYDCCYGFVVRAPDETAARRLASAAMIGDERPGAWLDPCLSECRELTTEGDPEVLLRDFLHG